MNENYQDNELSEKKALFDQIFRQHIERLVGSSHGIDGLPYNLATLSNIILFAEQSSNETAGFQTAEDRYSETTILAELNELGLGSIPDLDVTLREMIENGYIIIDQDQRLYAGKPAVSMAQLFDRVFPKMPGLNLIAYLAQTFDEVMSGRKDADAALSQLDETLQNQGVCIINVKNKVEDNLSPPSKKDNKGAENKRKDPFDSTSSILVKSELKDADRKNILKRGDISNSGGRFIGGSKIISAESISERVVIREVRFGQPASDAKIPHGNPNGSDAHQLSENPAPSNNVLSDVKDDPIMGVETDTDTPVEEIPGMDEISTSQQPISISEEDGHPVFLQSSLNENLFQEETASLLTETQSTSSEKPEDGVNDKSEDRIDQSILAFEEDLAMQCPLCKTAKVVEEITPTGKTYYKCSNKKCQFISWGKPYHLPCPLCQNPFLVETTGPGNIPILKCPRATCRYWQKNDDKINEDMHTDTYSVVQPNRDILPPKTSKPRKRVKKKKVLVRRKR